MVRNTLERTITDVRVFNRQSSRRDEWEQVTSCLMTLDCLCSLAEYARVSSYEMCLPKILPSSKQVFTKSVCTHLHFKPVSLSQPTIKIEEGVHPSLKFKETIIPNSSKLGGNMPPVMILTGPNMGGKSTLMRQIALIVILAQMASYTRTTSYKNIKRLIQSA